MIQLTDGVIFECTKFKVKLYATPFLENYHKALQISCINKNLPLPTDKHAVVRTSLHVKEMLACFYHPLKKKKKTPK